MSSGLPKVLDGLSEVVKKRQAGGSVSHGRTFEDISHPRPSARLRTHSQPPIASIAADGVASPLEIG